MFAVFVKSVFMTCSIVESRIDARMVAIDSLLWRSLDSSFLLSLDVAGGCNIAGLERPCRGAESPFSSLLRSLHSPPGALRSAPVALLGARRFRWFFLVVKCFPCCAELNRVAGGCVHELVCFTGRDRREEIARDPVRFRHDRQRLIP